MIISRTPVRISFLGGGTDYPSWAKQHGGLVVGGAIKQYSYITARHLPSFHPYKTRLAYSKIETVGCNQQIEHRVIKAIVKYVGLENNGLEITHMSDLPSKTGTGSSSTFSVGLMNALLALKGQFAAPFELTNDAIHVEQDLLQETVGCQDQTFAAYGGLNAIAFAKNGDINVNPLPLNSDDVRDLEQHLLLFFTGETRTASEIAATYVPSLPTREREQWAMLRMAEQGISAIQRKDWLKLGELMGQAWQVKRKLSSSVSTREIDQMYNDGIRHGAVGGKLLGAGGGGCMLFVVPPEKATKVRDAMRGLIEIKVRFDFNGSRIIFADLRAD